MNSQQLTIARQDDLFEEDIDLFAGPEMSGCTCSANCFNCIGACMNNDYLTDAPSVTVAIGNPA